MTTITRRNLRPVSTWAAAAAAAVAVPAHASFLSGEVLESAANVLSWIVIFLVPAVAIVVFWMVHVLPEKIAHKRHHPQQQAIQTLCLLSLVFGGLLWPIAWLWAYTKPIGHKAAYGTDKHEDYFAESIAKARAGNLDDHEIAMLETELDEIQARAALSPELRRAWTEMRAARASGASPTAGADIVPARAAAARSA